MFKRQFTKLDIEITVKPGDEHTQNEIIYHRERFRSSQVRGGCTYRKLKTDNRMEFSYFVGNTGTIPLILAPALYWLFALLGHSLFYRFFVYVYIGHVRYKVKKRVFELELVPPTAPSQSMMTEEISNAAAGSLEPPSYTVKPSSHSQQGPPSPPPSYFRVVSTPSPPPDYHTVCFQPGARVESYDMSRFT